MTENQQTEVQVELIPQKLVVTDPELKDCDVTVLLHDGGPTYQPVRSYGYQELTEENYARYQDLLVKAKTLADQHYEDREQPVPVPSS